ncbi:MAG: hypothetical protein U0Z26_05800 [Anaerolineales bacterium]
MIGFISGMWMLFSDKKKSMDMVFYISAALAVLTALLFFLNRDQSNMLFFDPGNNVFGDAKISLFAGIAILVGFALILCSTLFLPLERRCSHCCNLGYAWKHHWFAFASLADIVINGLTLPATIVGQFCQPLART